MFGKRTPEKAVLPGSSNSSFIPHLSHIPQGHHLTGATRVLYSYSLSLQLRYPWGVFQCFVNFHYVHYIVSILHFALFGGTWELPGGEHSAGTPSKKGDEDGDASGYTGMEAEGNKCQSVCEE